MSKKSWEDYTVAEQQSGYEKYGIWNLRGDKGYNPDFPAGLLGVRNDAPEWLKKCWEFDEQQRKDGIKV